MTANLPSVCKFNYHVLTINVILSHMEVILIAAITADGFIAQSQDQVSTIWTSKADRAWFAQKTREIGVVVMGKNTYKTIGRPLPGRHNIVYTSNPDIKNRDPQMENLEFTNLDPTNLIKDLELRGYTQVAICGGASIYTLFMQAKLITKMFLTIEPVFFGQGIKLFNQSLDDINLELIESKTLGEEGTILLEYNLSK